MRTERKIGLLSDESRAQRYMLAKALADDPREIEGIIRQRFLYDEQWTKAAAPAVTAADLSNERGTSVDFMKHLTRNSVVAAIYDRTMRAGFNARFNSPFSATAEYVPEGHAIPAFSDSLASYLLDTKKVGACVAMTKEALEQEDAEEALGMAMTEACGNAIDEYFLDADALKSDAPTPITVGAPSIASTADPAASIRALLRNLSSWSAPVLVMHPETGVQLNLSTIGGASPFLDVGATGGSICGIEVITTESAPQDSTGSTITLIDCSRIAMAMGGLTVTKTESASLELQDTIDSNGTGAELVNLWQADAVAMKTLMIANWAKLDDDAVRVLTGCDW